MSGWYELRRSSDGQFDFVLKAPNHEVILVSERYTAKASALTGIGSCQTHSPYDGSYVRLQSSDGKPYFNLKASNGQFIGTSQRYASLPSREAGIAAVKTHGPSRDIRDQT